MSYFYQPSVYHPSVYQPSVYHPYVSGFVPQYGAPLRQSVVVPQQSLRESVKGESHIEKVPYQRRVVEYEERTHTYQVPVEKFVEDFYEVEHQTEYVPQVSVVPKTKTDYVPVETVEYEEKVDYVEVKRQVRKTNPVDVVAPSHLSYAPYYGGVPLRGSVVGAPVVYGSTYGVPVRGSFVGGLRSSYVL